MVLHVLRHRLTCIQSRLDLGVRDVTAYYDGSIEAQAGADRIFRKNLADLGHRLVEIDPDSLALARIAVLFRDEFVRLVVHLFDPDTVGIDLRLDVAVCGAADSKADRAACAVTRKTDDTDVVSKILAAELCSEADLLSLHEELVLKIDIAESAACLIAGGRKAVVEMGGSELDGEKVLLS